MHRAGSRTHRLWNRHPGRGASWSLPRQGWLRHRAVLAGVLSGIALFVGPSLSLAASPPPRPQKIAYVQGTDQSQPWVATRSDERAARQQLSGLDDSPGEAPSAATDAARREGLLALWGARREAAAAGRSDEARALLGALVAAKRRSPWPDFVIAGEALAREAQRAAAKEDWSQATVLARAAVELAPHWPVTHAAAALVHWGSDDDFMAAAGALLRSARLFVREAPLFWGRVGNLGLALAAALLWVAAAFSLAALARHGRLLVHDIWHFLPAGAGAVQAWVVGLLVILVPVLLGVGAMWCLLIWVVLMARYYVIWERIAACLVVAFLGALPLLLPALTAHLGYPGSRAQNLYLVVHDVGAEDVAEQVQSLKTPTMEEHYGLGLRALWSGDTRTARWRLQSAYDAGGRFPELLTALGNLHVSVGDKPRAIAAYEEAMRVDPEYVAAYFNLSRLHFSMTNHQKASDLHRRATAIDYEKMDEFALLMKQRGPDHLVVPEIPKALFASVSEDGLHSLAVSQVWRDLAGNVARQHFSAVAALACLLVVALGWIRLQGRVPSTCRRCGHAACRRCYEDLPDLTSCGTCHRAFVNQSAGAQQLRISKQIEGYRYHARRKRTHRLLLLLAAGASQLLAGRSLRGLALLTAFTFCGLVVAVGTGLLVEPRLAPTYSGLTWLGATVAGIAMLVVYLVSLWDGRRGRE